MAVRRRQRPWVAYWTTAITALAVSSGLLLMSGALDPVLQDVITGALGRDHAGSGNTGSGRGLPASRVADWQYFDDRPEWSSLRGVPQVQRPADPVAPARPLVAPPENPHRFVFSGPPPMPHYKLKSMSSCPQPRGPNHYVEHYTATLGVGSATVSWWDLGDPDTLEYTLVSVPDYVNVFDGSQPIIRTPIVRTTVAAPGTCRRVSATVTGLISGMNYDIVLQATNTSRTQLVKTYVITRAQTGALLIP